MHSALRNKKYTAPKLKELALERAKAFLPERAHGGRDAKELLNLLKQTSAQF